MLKREHFSQKAVLVKPRTSLGNMSKKCLTEVAKFTGSADAPKRRSHEASPTEARAGYRDGKGDGGKGDGGVVPM